MSPDPKGTSEQVIVTASFGPCIFCCDYFSAIRFWRGGARPVRGWITLVLLHRSLFGRTYPVASILRRAIHMLASANSMCSCAVFLAKPR